MLFSRLENPYCRCDTRVTKHSPSRLDAFLAFLALHVLYISCLSQRRVEARALQMGGIRCEMPIVSRNRGYMAFSSGHSEFWTEKRQYAGHSAVSVYRSCTGVVQERLNTRITARAPYNKWDFVCDNCTSHSCPRSDQV